MNQTTSSERDGFSVIAVLIVGIILAAGVGGYVMYEKSHPLRNLENFFWYKNSMENFTILGEACEPENQPRIDAYNKLVNGQTKKILIINDYLRLLLTSSAGYQEVDDVCRGVVAGFVKPYPETPDQSAWKNILWRVGSCPMPASINQQCVDDLIKINEHFYPNEQRGISE